MDNQIPGPSNASCVNLSDDASPQARAPKRARMTTETPTDEPKTNSLVECVTAWDALDQEQKKSFLRYISMQDNTVLRLPDWLCQDCSLPNGSPTIKHFLARPVVCSSVYEPESNNCSYQTLCRYAFVRHLFAVHYPADLKTKYEADTLADFAKRKVLCRDCGQYGMDPIGHLAANEGHSVCHVEAEDIEADPSDTEHNKLAKGEFIVKEVLQKAFKNGKLAYFHSWVDWPADQASWTPILESNFLHLIMAFEEKSKLEKKRRTVIPPINVATLQDRNTFYVSGCNNDQVKVHSITLMNGMADRLVVEYPAPVQKNALCSQNVLIKVEVPFFVNANKNNLKKFFELISECFKGYIPNWLEPEEEEVEPEIAIEPVDPTSEQSSADIGPDSDPTLVPIADDELADKADDTQANLDGTLSNENPVSGQLFNHIHWYAPTHTPQPKPQPRLTTSIEVAEPENEPEMISKSEPGSLSPPVQVEANAAQSVAITDQLPSSHLSLPNGLNADLFTLEAVAAVPMDIADVGPSTSAPMSREQLEQRIKAILPAASHVSIISTEVNEDGSQSLVLRLKNISNTFMDTSPGTSSSSPTSIQTSGSGSSPNYGSTALSPLSMASPSCLINETNEAEQPRQQQPTNNIQCQGIDHQSQHQRQ